MDSRVTIACKAQRGFTCPVIAFGFRRVEGQGRQNGSKSRPQPSEVCGGLRPKVPRVRIVRVQTGSPREALQSTLVVVELELTKPCEVPGRKQPGIERNCALQGRQALPAVPGNHVGDAEVAPELCRFRLCFEQLLVSLRRFIEFAGSH